MQDKTKSSIGEQIARQRKRMLKDNRTLQLMGIKDKEAREVTLEEYHGIYYNLLTHEAVKGHTKSVKALFDRIDQIWKDYNNLKDMKMLSENSGHHTEWGFEFIYSRDGKKNIPSQKNSHIVRGANRNRRGKGLALPKDIQDFRLSVGLEWDRKFDVRPSIQYCHIDIVLYFGNFRETDPDGKLTTILDALVKQGIISNDSWLRVGRQHIDSLYTSGKSGFYIKIYEYSRKEFMKLRNIPEEVYNKKNIKW